MNSLIGFALVGVLIIVPSAVAQTFTAICSEPIGHLLILKDGAWSSGNDRTGAGSTYSWDLSQNRVTIVTQQLSSAGGEPLTLRGKVFRVVPNQISFLVEYERGVEFHSIFLDSGVLLISTHKDFSLLVPGMLTGSILRAKCKIAVEK